jgi:hypothetical protein
MSKEKLLVINSKDRTSGTNGDFEVLFSDSSCQQVIKTMVKDCFVPNLLYNINGTNNTLEFKQNAEPNQIVTVPTGQYTIDQLITQLKASIDTKLIDGVIVTITKGATLFNLIFTFSGAGTPANNSVTFFKDPSLIADLIGLTSDVGPSTVLTMPAPYNLKGPEYIQIHSPQVAETHGLDGGASGYISLLETVSLANTGFGTSAHRQNNDDELAMLLYEQPRNISRIRIVLRDESGVRMVLPDNAYVTVILKIFFD